MRFIAGRSADLPPQLMRGVASYRHSVFVQKLGWQLACEENLEYDQFDRADTVYMVAQNTHGDIIGTARLLPTSSPYLLGDVFPQLLNGLPIPKTDEVWELSRFAAVDFNIFATGRTGSTRVVDGVAIKPPHQHTRKSRPRRHHRWHSRQRIQRHLPCKSLFLA